MAVTTEAEAGILTDDETQPEQDHQAASASASAPASAPASASVSPRVPAKRRLISPSSRTDQDSQHSGARPVRATKSLAAPDRSITTRKFQSEASLVLIGIRGSGKRSLGFIAATALGRRFITEDHFFHTVTGLTRQDYLRTHGSEEFHRIDVEVSQRMLDENRTGCVIDCGLGSLTSGLQEYLKTYSLTNPVIYILRDMDPIKQLLKLGERSARLLEAGDPSHRRCSNYEFYNMEDHSGLCAADGDGPDRGSPAYSFKLRETQTDFSYFVERVTANPTDQSGIDSPFSLNVPVDRRLFTHAMEIPFSLYQDGKIRIQDLQAGGDVVEIHVDRWRNNPMRCLTRMIAEVRRELRVPILLSANRQKLPENYVGILKHCLRLAAEFVSVDLYLEPKTISEFMALKGPTRIMGSAILRPSEGKSVWLDGLALAAYDLAVRLQIDIVRLMYVAKDRADNDDVKHLTYLMEQRTPNGPSVIAYNIGPLGRTSQVLNPTLTTVTHKLLRDVQQGLRTAQTPQITAQDAMKALFSSYILDPLSFCIVGGNVSESLSPSMHNAAYKLLGLSHTYTTKNIQSWEEVEELAKNPHFGGASVVQPWKVRLATRVTHLSQHARIIGAINTLLPLRSGHDRTPLTLEVQAAQRNRAGPIVDWYGDNTDWIAISGCLGRGLSPRNVVQPKSTALIIGAGGMARSAIYGLIKMGCRSIFIYNRTRRNAETLAEHYNQWLSSRDPVKSSPPFQIRLLDSLDAAWPADHVMPTIIVSCVTHEHLEGNTDSNFTVPQQWLHSESGGVVLELAYMTRETPLTKQIKEFRAVTSAPWVLVDGLEALFEQALAQFELMTGRRAPKSCMREAIFQTLQSRQSFTADGAQYKIG